MNLRDRIIEITKKYGLSHLGSNLSAIGILDEIFPKGEVIVSCGHAGLAYYVVREKYWGMNAEAQFRLYGVHAPMYGSLGHGIGIALGKALADLQRDIYCLISDGECMEGSVYEALRLARKLNTQNLKIYVNANGYGGMEAIDLDQLERQLKSFGFPIEFRRTTMEPLENNLEAHYKRL
jgi:transketolase